MTHPNRHRIQRQILEVIVGTTAQGSAVHQQLARPFWDHAMPELEVVFDRAAGPGKLVQLDRLELDLGTIGGDWPSAFKPRLIAELTRSLAECTAVSERQHKDEHGERLHMEPWRQFLFFLAHGHLPWWAVAPIGRWNDVLSVGSDTDWKALRETIASDSRARLRLIYSVGDDFLARAIVRWSGVPDTAPVLDKLTPAHLHAARRRRWRREFWMLVLDWLAAGGSRPSFAVPQLVRDLKRLRAMYESNAAASPAPAQSTSEGGEHGGRSRTFEGDLLEPWRSWWLSQHDTALEGAMVEPRADVGDAKGGAPVMPTSRARSAEKGARPDAEDDVIYLAGAGVVLVHPFLEQLFRELGLLDGRNFCSLDARDRAVQMIGLITFGRADVPEHELVLAKVLCGVAIEEPLEPVLLDANEVSACDALVRAVLQHWTALRSSSPAWLREHFFLRDGKLEDVDSGRRLTIERRAQDVLLARLPWGFGVVAPPWLTTHVYVHWLD